MQRRELLALLALAAGCSERPPGGAATCAVPRATERADLIASLRQGLKRQRPVVAVIVSPNGAETSDVMVPYSILARSGLADVRVVSPARADIPLMPALVIRPQLDFADFDGIWRGGADVVIVPALHRADEPAVLAWIRRQHALGALMVGVCAGALVLSAAGLIAGRRATTHWYQAAALQRANPGMTLVRNRRFVVDRGVVTTTGISAAIPASLALVEAIGPAERAEQLAKELGTLPWSNEHDSDAFGLTGAAVWTAVRNRLRGQRHLGIAIAAGVDELALSLAADVYSSTQCSSAYAVAPRPGVVRGAAGLDIVATAPPGMVTRLDLPTGPPGQALDWALAGVADAFGMSTARFAALSLEYPWECCGSERLTPRCLAVPPDAPKGAGHESNLNALLARTEAEHR